MGAALLLKPNLQDSKSAWLGLCHAPPGRGAGGAAGAGAYGRSAVALAETCTVEVNLIADNFLLV